MAQSANIRQLFMSLEDKGDMMFDQLYFEKAIEIYEKALVKNDKNHLRFKIANSYNILREYRQAEYWYAQAIENDSLGVPERVLYDYAEVLAAQARFIEAEQYYEQFRIKVPGDTRVDRKLEAIKNRRYLFRDSVLLQISNLPLNSDQNEFGARYYKDGIVFLSSNGIDLFVDQDYLREERLFDLYYAATSDSLPETMAPFETGINSAYHESIVSFADNENMIFTRNNYYNKEQIKAGDGTTKLQLFTAEFQGKQWGKLRPFPHNDPNYNFSEPVISPSGDTLFFVSDMPGGLGGKDIYISIKENNRWTRPVNLGPEINTEGDDSYPYFVGNVLFFSSDGYGGLGGLDIYRSKLNERGRFSRVVNLGYPVNSNKDDFSYIVSPTGDSGYFASNRDGGKGKDDLYFFENSAVLINGVVTSKEEIVDEAVVTIFDSDGNEMASTLSDDQGRFYFYIPYDSDFELLAEKAGFTQDETVPMTTKTRQVVMDTLELGMWKHEIFAQGEIYSNETQLVLDDVRVILTDLETRSLDTVHTIDDGHYIFPLKPGRKYDIRAEKDHFLPFNFEITTTEIKTGIIRNDVVLESEYVDKDAIFFEYNESYLTKESKVVMDEMVKVLKKYPGTWLVIGAHADSRGTREYNLELSTERADNAVNYFISKGIDRSRIIAHPFGESLIINRCYDGINCQEEEHAQNRRADLKIELELPDEELQGR